MNLLAHLHLSQKSDPDTLTANVLADYLGRYEPIREMSPDLQKRFSPGIELHQSIDLFTDRHPVVAASRNLISNKRRRLAGVILDIAFDYYLVRHWHRFSSESMAITISRGYATMAQVTATAFSPETRRLVYKMQSSDWLTCYGTLEGQALTFSRVSKRTPAVAALVGAEEELIENDKALDRCFLQFYPDLLAHVQSVTSLD